MTPKGHDKLVQAAPTHVTGVRNNLVDIVSPEDFDALGRIFNAVSDHLLEAHPETDMR